MMSERPRLLIASDKDNVGFRKNLEDGAEREGSFIVVKLSRIKTSRIRSEIISAEPDIVLLSASLKNDEEINELRSFVRKLKKHVPDAKVIIHGPVIEDDSKKTIGAEGWVSETLPYEYLSQELSSIFQKK